MQKCAKSNYFQFAAAILETHCTQLDHLQTVAIHRQKTTATLRTSKAHHFWFAVAMEDFVYNQLHLP